jgi:adenylylsulfate kinase
LERSLHENGLVTAVLYGDNLRSGLNKDLGFSDEDREENLRRVAEVAKLFAASGLVTIVSFITPRQEFRETARAIVGEDDFREVYVKASYATCEERDVKGLYAKARAGEISDFTGKASAFDEPNSPWLTIDTEKSSPEASLAQLMDAVLPLVQLPE